MLKQSLRLVGLLWLLHFFSLFGLQWLADIQNVPLIAYFSEYEREIDVFLGDSASGLTVRITQNSSREDQLRWSPDGRYLYFDIWNVPDSYSWLLDTTTWTLEELNLGEYSAAFWHSPNELLLRVNRTEKAYLFHVETEERRAYAESLPCNLCVSAIEGRRINAYDLELRIVNGELHVVIDKMAYLAAVFEPNTTLQPWSPDGQSLIFITALQGQPDLYLISAEGGIARRLTNTPTPEQMPRWSGDGQQISYLSYEAGNPEIFVMDLATGASFNLSRHEGRDYNAVWQSVR